MMYLVLLLMCGPRLKSATYLVVAKDGAGSLTFTRPVRESRVVHVAQPISAAVSVLNELEALLRWTS
jgi:hypothetical protein